MKDNDAIHSKVQEYYGETLKSSNDLQSSCCTAEAPRDEHKKILSQISDEVLEKFYGCGSPIPSHLAGKTILDLGCGTGRDCYLLSKLAGPTGHIIGVDMTENQLAVAKKYQAEMAQKWGFEKSNITFVHGTIEDLKSCGIQDGSVDVVISNCVINLTPDKKPVFEEIFRVLKNGGELYFSDVYSDRRIPVSLRNDPVFYGECLGGALYIEDFRRILAGIGIHDPRIVSQKKIALKSPEMEKRAGDIGFYSITYRAFNLKLEDREEDYGQTARYTAPHSDQPEIFILDENYQFPRDKEIPVSANTAAMLSQSRLGESFVIGENTLDEDIAANHRGLFSTAFSVLKESSCCCADTESADKQNQDTEVSQSQGYIQPQNLEELWIHTGTNCNLSCDFCLEGAKPGDSRIALISFEEAKVFIDEARELGVKRISFTGGEPFMNKAFPQILAYALDYFPVLVLTNGTGPLLKQIDSIISLKDKPNPLSFRVSLDYPEPIRHDKQRGSGNFRKALHTAGTLYKEGFGVSIARIMEENENAEAVNQAFSPYFEEAGLPQDTRIVTFPDFKKPGSKNKVPHITEHCLAAYLTEEQRKAFMCNFSKMVVKKDETVGIYACTLVDDDPSFNLAPTLREAMEEKIPLSHHRCYVCFSHGSSCSEG